MPPDVTDGSAASLDLTAAAERLGVHYQTAYRWVRDGSLPASRVLGRYRVEVAAVDAFARARVEPRPVSERPKPPRWGRLGTRAESQLLDGDEGALRTLVVDLRDRGVPVTEILSNLFVPALRSIGEGWAAGTVTVPQEHRASAVVERLLGELAPRPRGRRRGTAVVASLSGEHHGLPTAMAATALREDRWHVEHLGSDVPADELARFTAENRPDLVVLSVAQPEHAPTAEALRGQLEGMGFPTLVGGPGRTLDELRGAARACSPAARRATAAKAVTSSPPAR